MEAIVKFSVKRIIDAFSAGAWDKAVFEQSWFEFRLQIQNYHAFSAYTDFADFLKTAPEADKIHARVSPSVHPMLSQIGPHLPNVTDTAGEPAFLTQQFSFQILDSDFDRKEKHKVSLEFISGPKFLIGEFGGNYLLAEISDIQDYHNGLEIPTFSVPFQANLGLYSIQKIQ